MQEWGKQHGIIINVVNFKFYNKSWAALGCQWSLGGPLHNRGPPEACLGAHGSLDLLCNIIFRTFMLCWWSHVAYLTPVRSAYWSMFFPQISKIYGSWFYIIPPPTHTHIHVHTHTHVHTLMHTHTHTHTHTLYNTLSIYKDSHMKTRMHKY